MSTSSSPSSSEPAPRLKPFLKWPGGKGRELKNLLGRIPPRFGRYLEPFVGGGAAYFALAGEEAAINDAHPLLMRLYAGVQEDDRALHQALRRFATLWDRVLPGLVEEASPLVDWYLRRGRAAGGEAPGKLLAAFRRSARRGLARERGAGLDPEELSTVVTTVLRKRVQRMRALEVKHETDFDAALVGDQVETGVRSGFYTWVRDELRPRTRADEAAAFYFVRELCYGSMFRFNAEGRFNIPYGGIGYNKKRLGPKLRDLFSPARRAHMAGHELSCEDFRSFFERWLPRLEREDLVFLDPPYDSDFSEYGGRAFGDEEHADLAALVARMPCHVVAILKETPRIRELYEAAREARPRKLPELLLEPYSKTYAYNVRGRNDREATHLLIHTLGQQRRLPLEG